NLKETYNRIAEDWHHDHVDDAWWVEGTDAFIKELPQGGSVLDVGCGSGVKSKYFAERGCKVVGIDISDGLLDIARREVPEAEFRELSMTDLDSMTETFDGVFAQASLLHIPKKEAGEVVKKLAGRLVPGGLLYIAVKEVRADKPEEVVERENDYGYEYERFFSYFTLEELEQYLRDAGLEVVSKSRSPNPSGKTVWLQIIGKGC
ncbi:MAG: class I SAM-dependent methyltransferase, partial [Candidatus Kaiserbacteria bacterium]|nr:class I SAM-dependent methyltransferase [Candidatus Kaiserbacteria bacterium]